MCNASAPDAWHNSDLDEGRTGRPAPVGPVELAADRLLVDVLGAEHVRPPTDGVERAAAGSLLVAGRPPVGFAQVLEEDGTAHLQQLVVHPDVGRQGIGAALVEACCAEAARRGYTSLTLTTFRDVPFNAPFYGRRGFVTVPQPDGVVAEHLARERDLERAGVRVAMVRRWGP